MNEPAAGEAAPAPDETFRHLREMIARLHTFRCYAPTDYECAAHDEAAALAYQDTDDLAAALASAAPPETERLRDALVEAAIPLEVLVASEATDGEYREISPTLRAAIHQALSAIRRALGFAPSPAAPTPEPQEGTP